MVENATDKIVKSKTGQRVCKILVELYQCEQYEQLRGRGELNYRITLPLQKYLDGKKGNKTTDPLHFISEGTLRKPVRGKEGKR